MSNTLIISVGQFSDKGRKKVNQDFHGVYIPKEPQLSAKGIAIALADGISSSDVSQIASEATVKGFLEDYYCTSDAWSVKKSAQRVLMATNSWLHSQTQQSQYRFDKDKGYVCTFSALIVKSTTAYIFHVGDTRIYRVHSNRMEQLTNDHRLWVSEDQSYLSRALGINSQLEIDYQALQVEQGDVFVLATDGVYEYSDAEFMSKTINENTLDLNIAANIIVEEALQRGSTDNLTIQIIKIDSLPKQDATEIYQKLTELPFPPVLDARVEFDGYKIIREVHATSRSHVYLATDNETNLPVILKTPSIDMQQDIAYLERFLMEEWIARRINNAHVLKPCSQTRKRHYFYTVTEFIDGQTLTQWMIDNPKPGIETVRGLVEQIAKGLRAFHRLEMVHQDIRPENIMIDSSGTVKIIDFGSTKVAGVAEIETPIEHHNLLGTAAYTAPEYFLGESGSSRADIFSLGVITYQLLTGELPYGTQIAKIKSKSAQLNLNYQSALYKNRDIPVWIDGTLKKALHPDPFKRYEDVAEFIYELRHPNKAFLNRSRPPLLERNPILFWKCLSFVLVIIILVLLAKQ
ncbi:MAG: bifunctional protein-serine/threonine kinase/phosphatase [Chitinophagaceae bacterium]|nr:MAG: bifunctional protein-serine/threonine kinase/phosphatase [Chitinophagaceae bacterium]